MADLNNHRNAGLEKRHPPHNWEFDNAALREAASIPPADSLNVSNLKKWALQLDEHSLWMLIDSIEDTENPGTYIPIWKALGGGVVGAYSYFGIRFNSRALLAETENTITEIKFKTVLGRDITPVLLSTDVASLSAALAHDDNLYTVWASSTTALPIYIYGKSDNVSAEEVKYIDIFTAYGDYGCVGDFDFVASKDGENWVTIQSFSNSYLQNTWQTFEINKSKVFVAMLESVTASQENGVPYDTFHCTDVLYSDVAYWNDQIDRLILRRYGVYRIRVQAQVVPVDSYYIIQNGRQETIVDKALVNFTKATHTSSDSDSSSPYTPETVISWGDDFIVDNTQPLNEQTVVTISLAFKNGYTGYSGVNFRALIMVEQL